MFTVVVAVVFALMVPNPTLERRAIESRRGDLLTVAYLANLLRTATRGRVCGLHGRPRAL